MRWLVIFALILSALVLAILFWVSRKTKFGQQRKLAQQQLYTVHEQALQELQQEVATGRMSEEAYQQAQYEAQRQLVEDMRQLETMPQLSAAGTSRLLPLGIVAVPLVAAVAYYYLGNWAASDPARTFAMSGNVEQFVGAVEQLERKAAAEPENMNHQVMLARSYRAMGRHGDAVAAYGRAWHAIKDNPTELALFAGVLAVYRGSFEGKPTELLDQALALDPQHYDALLLKGGAYYQQQAYAKAIEIWEKLKTTLPPDSEEYEDVVRQIADTRQAMVAQEQGVSSDASGVGDGAPESMPISPTPGSIDFPDIPEHRRR